MPDLHAHTLPKGERLSSRTLIESLFTGGHGRSMSAFPVRAVYMLKERNGLEPQLQVLVSVSKRKFKRAVKRNRVKRQLRVAFRMNKNILLDALRERDLFDQTIVIALIWTGDTLHSTAEVSAKVGGLFHRIIEKQWAL